MLGTYALSAGYYDAYYGQAQRVRTLLIREHRDALSRVRRDRDADLADGRVPDRRQGRRPARDVRLRPAHDPVLPRRACRASTSPAACRDGLPVGLQLIGAQFGENTLFRAGHALEQAIGFDIVPERLRRAVTRNPVTWEPVIGLEIHVQLKTRTKMFCRCAVGFGAGENTQTCPVCLGFPGALPVPNRQAIEWTIKLGLALGCEIAPRAVFARKNYFYPDLPKGYQISQYDLPSCINGKMIVPIGEGDHVIGIVRAHLEEDAAKTLHVGGDTGRIGGADYSLVDYNRGGTPLVEIVTAPDIRSADEAKRFLQLLRQTIVELGISDAEMEKGTLRVDANVSVRPAGSDELRTRCEIKNMNSFNYIARGIDAEVARQIAVWEAGGEVRQETFDFDAGYRHADPAAREGGGRRLPLLPGARSRSDRAACRTWSSGSARSCPSRRRRASTGSQGDARPRAGARARHRWARPAVGGDGCGRRRARRRRQRDREQRSSAPASSRARCRPAELAKLVEARDRIPRQSFDEAISKLGEPGFSAAPYLAQEAVSDASELEPIVERDPRRAPEPGRGVPVGQGGPARLLRRSGDEGDGRQGERASRQRDRARAALRLVVHSGTARGVATPA